MQCAMSVSLLLLLTASCVSRSVHVSPRGIWAVITLCETLCYVDITCVMSVSKSPLLFIVSYDFLGAEDRKQHLAHTSLLITVCAIRASTTSPLH